MWKLSQNAEVARDLEDKRELEDNEEGARFNWHREGLVVRYVVAEMREEMQTCRLPARRQRPVPLRAADARRSVKNIREWNTYLPPDCVKAMVRMGWDYTT